MALSIYPNPVPHLTTEQMVEVDRAMIEDYHIELIQMMENAGRNLAHLARIRFLGGQPRGKKVIVLAGTGGNGGGALVSARRLLSWGAQVQVFLAKPAGAFTPVPSHQLDILERMQASIAQADSVLETVKADLIVDGLIGYSLAGNPRGATADLIQWANIQTTPVLALDVPSGLDAASGTVFEPAVQATATMTLALPKQGLLVSDVEAYVGELYLADISVPPSLYAGPSLGIELGPLFAESEIIRLR